MIKKIIRQFDRLRYDYLDLNPSEIRAFPRILLILLFLLFLPTFITRCSRWVNPAPGTAIRPLPAGFVCPEAVMDTGIFSHYKPVLSELFYFDPNVLPVDSFKLLGLPAWMAKRVDTYRKRYPFRIRKDFKRIYGLQDSLYMRLHPYILLSDTFARRVYAARKPRFSKGLPYPKLASINLNTADTFLFATIPGIGKSYARRIAAYRTRLGGFVDKNQLYEIWGIDSVAIDTLLNHSLIAPNYKPVQLSLNRAKEPDLYVHPYMPRRLARIIMQYRVQHGAFKKTEDLMRVQILKIEDFKRLEPYLFADSSETVVLPEVQIYKPKSYTPKQKKSSNLPNTKKDSVLAK